MCRLAEVKPGTKYEMDGAFVGRKQAIGGLLTALRAGFEFGS